MIHDCVDVSSSSFHLMLCAMRVSVMPCLSLVWPAE